MAKQKTYIKYKGRYFVSTEEIERVLSKIENQTKLSKESLRRDGIMETENYVRGVNEGFRFCIEQARQELEI